MFTRSISLAALLFLSADRFVFAAGPDVILSESGTVQTFAAVGGIHAYAIGSNTCNIGNQNLLWSSNNTPGLASNAYRLYNGRLEQIGMSWVKTACCAGASAGCGMGCNGVGGSQLGAGCLDVYDAGWNSTQSRMARRSGINAFTGAFTSADTSTGNSIYKRLQINDADLSPTTFPGALYFLEGMYVGTDDAQNSNWLNNASYKRVTFNASLTAAYAGAMNPQRAAIYAWKDHGLGVGVPDPDVTIVPVDVPAEGRFYLGYKVSNLGSGQWRYEYVVYNMNSDKSAGGFFVPAPAGVEFSNVGFHDVAYHSGEPFDGTDWISASGSSGIAWQCAQTFDQNPNANALRWGTMYSFWFVANSAPDMANVSISLFKPHSPQSVSVAALVPGCASPGDLNGDGLHNGDDIASFTSCSLSDGQTQVSCLCADVDGNGTIDALDADALVNSLLSK